MKKEEIVLQNEKELKEETKKVIIEEKQYVGIGGWLIVVMISYFISIISCVFSVLQLIAVKLSYSYMFDDKLNALIYFEMIVNILSVIFIIICLIFFFSKRKIYPKIAISFIVFNIVFQLLDLIFANAIGFEINIEDISSITSSLVGVIIWISYFIKSKRVQNTYVK